MKKTAIFITVYSNHKNPLYINNYGLVIFT